jgi:hypothetical protein
MADITNSYCNNCIGYRRHEVLHKEEKSWHEDLDEHSWIAGDDTYEMVKCCGCEHISLRHKSRFSEDRDENGKPITHINYYPPALYRKKPKWINDLVWSLGFFTSDIINEIYVALQNNSHRLAAMGIRALLEYIMINKVGDNGSFNKNLNKFHTQGFISDIQKEILEPIFEAGHATMHRSYNPSETDLLILIDVAESIIESIYINKQRVKKISKNIPPRIKKSAEPINPTEAKKCSTD